MDNICLFDKESEVFVSKRKIYEEDIIKVGQGVNDAESNDQLTYDMKSSSISLRRTLK